MNKHEADLNKNLAAHAVKNILIVQGIKWALIIGITKALKRAAEKAQS